MKKEFYLVFIILTIGFCHRFLNWTLSSGYDSLLIFTGLIQLSLLIFYTIYLIIEENRKYIIALLLLLILGFIGELLDLLKLVDNTLLMAIVNVVHVLILIQMVVDTQKKRDSRLKLMSILMSLTILSRFISVLILESTEFIYPLNFIVLILGFMLIIGIQKKGLIIEPYLKIVTLQYALGTITGIFYILN
ncbi:hypothetical protein [Sediminitomix flava]|uniref:Uncharacterized protein n=1 Tax=Sediminitomix flava TaxID=379075 RepID=A0A315ZSP5_SEDFL|nr:hypothetical protein [Sediminitomix flava]PWJ37870.1 hypothetical protein BC781_1085 [Sediminitomix flava]